MTSPLSRLAGWFVDPVDARVQRAAAPGDDAARASRGRSARSRLAEVFVEPPAPAAAARRGDVERGVDVVRAGSRAHDAVAVLAQPAEAAAAGGAVALAMTRGCAVVLLWGAEPASVRGPAAPGARKLAARLADRGHRTVATGRLVVVALGEGIDEAARAAAAVPVPSVLVVAGPRDDRVDAVIAGHERLVAVGDGAVAELAAQSAAMLGVPSRTLALPVAPAARGLASAGLALVAPLRARVEEGLR